MLVKFRWHRVHSIGTACHGNHEGSLQGLALLRGLEDLKVCNVSQNAISSRKCWAVSKNRSPLPQEENRSPLDDKMAVRMRRVTEVPEPYFHKVWPHRQQAPITTATNRTPIILPIFGPHTSSHKTLLDHTNFSCRSMRIFCLSKIWHSERASSSSSLFNLYFVALPTPVYYASSPYTAFRSSAPAPKEGPSHGA